MGEQIMDQRVSNNGEQNQEDYETALEHFFKRAWNTDGKRDPEVLPTLRLCYLVEDYTELNEG